MRTNLLLGTLGRKVSRWTFGSWPVSSTWLLENFHALESLQDEFLCW